MRNAAAAFCPGASQRRCVPFARTKTAVAVSPFTAELDAPTARVLAALDGSQTLGQALAAAVEGVDSRAEGLELARRMLEIGFLELADGEDAR